MAALMFGLWLLAPRTAVEPDFLFVSTSCLEILGEKAVEGAPDLVVEVTSPSTRRRDEIDKRKLYEAAGVAEYWITDPELERVKSRLSIPR